LKGFYQDTQVITEASGFRFFTVIKDVKSPGFVTTCGLAVLFRRPVSRVAKCRQKVRIDAWADHVWPRCPEDPAAPWKSTSVAGSSSGQNMKMGLLCPES